MKQQSKFTITTLNANKRRVFTSEVRYMITRAIINNAVKRGYDSGQDGMYAGVVDALTNDLVAIDTMLDHAEKTGELDESYQMAIDAIDEA